MRIFETGGGVALARDAQAALTGLIRFLEFSLHEERSRGRSRKGGLLPGWAALGAGLGPAEGADGAVVEVVGDDEEQLLAFARRWLAGVQQAGGTAALADPFGEFDEERLAREKVHLADLLAVGAKDPAMLAGVLLRVIRDRAADGIVLPPGVVKEKWLDDQKGREIGFLDPHAAFQRVLFLIGNAVEDSPCLFLILRLALPKSWYRPLDGVQVRLRLLPVREGNGFAARVEHNRFRLETVGTMAEVASLPRRDP